MVRYLALALAMWLFAAPVRSDEDEKGTKIVGFKFGQDFHDYAPDKAILVGFEVVPGKFVDSEVIKAIRPMYRAGSVQSVGKPYGVGTTGVYQKILAKTGYAVGAIKVRTSLSVDGISVTFMKIVGDKLDPKDSYESNWYGGRGGGEPVTLTGDGKQLVGMSGKINTKNELCGIGLVFERPAKKK